MLEYLEDVGNEFDALFFLPMEDDDDIHIATNKYKNPGEEITGNKDWSNLNIAKKNKVQTRKINKN
jgi:hypothetical protein